MKEHLPILHPYICQNKNKEYYVNTIDVAMDLDNLLTQYTSEQIEREIRNFTALPIDILKYQRDPQNIINEIIDYSLK